MVKYTKKRSRNEKRNKRKTRSRQKGGDPILITLAVASLVTSIGTIEGKSSSDSSNIKRDTTYMADELWSKNNNELNFYIKQHNRDPQYDESRYNEDEKLIQNTYEKFHESYDISLNRKFNLGINPDDKSYISLEDINEVLEYSSKPLTEKRVTDKYDIYARQKVNGRYYEYEGKHPLFICDTNEDLCNLVESNWMEEIEKALIEERNSESKILDLLERYKLYPVIILEITAQYLENTNIFRRYHILKQIQKINIEGLKNKNKENLNLTNESDKLMVIGILSIFKNIIDNLCSLFKTIPTEKYHKGIKKYCKPKTSEKNTKDTKDKLKKEIVDYITAVNQIVDQIHRYFRLLKLKPTEISTKIEVSDKDNNNEDIETVKGEVRLVQQNEKE